MTAPMFASRLVIVHDDDRETVLRDVHYWPWDCGGAVSILDEHGNEIRKHVDVYSTLVDNPR